MSSDTNVPTTTTITSAAPAATTVTAPVSNSTPVVSTLANAALQNQTLNITSLEGRCKFPMGGLPSDMIGCIFMECISSGDVKGFMALGATNTNSYVMMRKLVNAVALTKLCPNLRILDARTFKFQADLKTIDKYNALLSYYKLEPFVEGRAGFTVIFNQGGLTLKDMNEKKGGVIVYVDPVQLSINLGTVSELDTGPEMISNSLITQTRNKSNTMQETRVKDEVGFDGKPTLIQSLVLLIATQKELGISLYGGEDPLTYGHVSTQASGIPLIAGGEAVPGRFAVVENIDWVTDNIGAGGRLKLNAEAKQI